MCSSPPGRYGCGSLSTAGLSTALQGALAVLVLLVWPLGYFVSIVWRKGQNPLDLQGKVNLAVSLLVLVILVLLNSPVLDSMRISVNSHMARYQSGKTRQTR